MSKRKRETYIENVIPASGAFQMDLARDAFPADEHVDQSRVRNAWEASLLLEVEGYVSERVRYCD